MDRTQVDRYVQQLEANARLAASERDVAQAQVAELSGQLELARREVAALTERLNKIAEETDEQSRDERVVRALEVAKSQAAEITARARASADHTWSAAEQASAALRDRYQGLLTELDRQHAEIQTAHETIMSSAQAQADETTAAAERRRKEIDDEAERDRIRIDRGFSETMNVRRTALRKEIETARTISARESERLIRAAGEDADRRIAAVTAEVDRLTALRNQLAGRLRGTQDLLDEITAALEPLDQEGDLTDDSLFFPLPAPNDFGGPVPPQRVPSPSDHPAPRT